MKLLVTNDDGINSVFFHELVHALQAAGHELYVVAPLKEQSWTGASKTRHRLVQSSKADHGFGCPTWTVDGTPSDCVNIAIAHLLPRVARPEPVEGPTPGAAGPEQTTCVEGVVSGINLGFNCTLGFILASGTVCAALEGVLHGLPAIAFSHDVSAQVYNDLKDHGGEPGVELTASLKASATHAARLAGELLPKTEPHGFTVHNVNFPFPCRPDTPVQSTVPAHFFVPGLFSPPDADGCHKLIWTQGHDVSPAGHLTDLQCIASGRISHTVLDYRKLGRA